MVASLYIITLKQDKCPLDVNNEAFRLGNGANGGFPILYNPAMRKLCKSQTTVVMVLKK
jgi:hypothetical protein